MMVKLRDTEVRASSLLGVMLGELRESWGRDWNGFGGYEKNLGGPGREFGVWKGICDAGRGLEGS